LPEVRELAALQDMTIILVTHDPLEAMSLCRSAVVLDQGSIVEAGPLTDLLDAPRSELLRTFHDEYSRHEPDMPLLPECASQSLLLLLTQAHNR